MGISYNFLSFPVVLSMVEEVTIAEGAIISQGNTGINNTYEIIFQHNAFGCGNPASAIVVIFKDTNPNWKYITLEFSLTGWASCWSFCSTSSWGLGSVNHYLQTYDESLGDKILYPKNSWEFPAVINHSKEANCDGSNADNFFSQNFNGYQPKTFFMRRRRDTSGNLAGIRHSRSCSSTGTGSRTHIKNIRLYC
jgi:hypothetical protein